MYCCAESTLNGDAQIISLEISNEHLHLASTMNTTTEVFMQGIQDRKSDGMIVLPLCKEQTH